MTRGLSGPLAGQWRRTHGGACEARRLAAGALGAPGGDGLGPWSEARGEEAAEEARGHFERGRQLEASDDLAGALEEYERAQELRPTFRLHRYLGRACRGLGRYVAALRHYEGFLEEGGELVEQQELREARQAIDALRRQVATLRVSANESAELFVDGVRVGATPLDEPVVVDPGPRVVELRLGGHEDFRREVTFDAGETLQLEVHLTPLAVPDVDPPGQVAPLAASAPEEGPLREQGRAPVSEIEREGRRRPVTPGLFWASAGLALATLVAGGVLGVEALREEDRFQELDDPYRDDELDATLRASGQRGESLSLAADVLIFTGAALALTAIVLAFFTELGRRSGRRSSAADLAGPLSRLGRGGCLVY